MSLTAGYFTVIIFYSTVHSAGIRLGSVVVGIAGPVRDNMMQNGSPPSRELVKEVKQPKMAAGVGRGGQIIKNIII